MTHEVMVLSLSPGQYQGQRAIGTNGQVDETGSLGEASRTCGADAGDGILAGATAWTSINLAPGRYELLCNIAGLGAAARHARMHRSPKLQSGSGRSALGSSRSRLRTRAGAGHPSQCSTGRDTVYPTWTAGPAVRVTAT